MVKKFLGNCLSFPFKRRSWTSERRIIEWFKKSLILLWIVYFILELEPDKNIFRVISKEIVSRVEQVIKFPFKEIYKNYSLTFLLSITFICVLINSILFLYKKHCRYKSLDKEEFPEYDFDFQKNLVVFLNAKSRFGHNIYWLDGAWGSGKTHFLRTFFEHQAFKKLEIYYVSCFGITSREQAERALIAEIEDRSSFGSLDYVPVAGSLIKWGFKTLGLNLMKKDSVVIFDDLERVVYSETGKDNPQDYNDLLGFIDYLANHKNQKVIVVYNSEEMPNTQRDVIGEKFSAIVNRIPSVDVVVDLLTSYNGLEIEDFDYGRRVEFISIFLEKIYKIRYRALGRANFRQLYQEIEKYTGDDIIKDEIEEVIISSLNSIASSKYFQFMCEEISRDPICDFSNPYKLPLINGIAVRLIDGIKTSDLFDFWCQHQELFEFLMKYNDDYPILSGIKIVTIEDDRYIYKFPKDSVPDIDLG